MKPLLQTIKPTTWIGVFGLFAIISVTLFPQIAFAQDTIEAILFFVISNLTGWLLWVGGSLLDYGINTFVINFGLIYTTGGVGLAVDQLWVLVRDLFNILFIFGLVYIGFKMILNSDDSQTKKTLVSLIIAALLINFSLFVTKFVVDFTNILAAEIAVAGFDTVGSDVDGDPRSVRVGDTFFRLMGIAPLNFSGENAPGLDGDGTAPWSYIFGIGIINIIGAFAFGVGGIMLIIRFIALSVYMVLSPFMFLGWIFPGFKGMSDKYWSGFLKQSFYAPVYIIMIFFAASILDNFFGTGGAAQGGGLGNINAAGSDVFTPSGDVSVIAASFAGGLGPFILSAGFLIAAVQVAGKLASDGSGVMSRVTGSVNSRVRGAVRGGGRFGARVAGAAPAYGISYGSEKFANSRAYRRLNAGLGNNVLTRPMAKGLEKTVEAGRSAKVRGSTTYKDAVESTKKRQNQVNDLRDITGREDAIIAYRKNATDENKGKAAGAIAKMTDAELLGLSNKDLQDPKILANLSESQIKTLKESGRFKNEELKTIKSDREAAIFTPLETALGDTSKNAEELNTAMEDLSKTVKNLSTEQLEGMDKDRLNSQAIASQLTDKQLDNIRDSGKIPADHLNAIQKTRAEGLASIAATGGIKGQQIPTGTQGTEFVQKQREKLVKGSVQDVGKLPPQVFMDPNMASIITPAMLQQRVRNGLSTQEAKSIQDNIEEHITKPGTPDRVTKMWTKWTENTTEGGRFEF